ncbi:MAG: ribonuclease R [Bacilli bacterium]|nr:ribonuclease R [Bacilli bacterium]
MRDKILEILSSSEKALSSIELLEALNMNSVSELTSLYEVLNDLEDEALIYKTRKDKYMLFENSHLKIGRLSVNKKGFGFVTVPNLEDDIYIDESNLNGALDGDTVIIEDIKGTGKKDEGRVVKILKKGNSYVVGTYDIVNNKPSFTPDNQKLKMHIIIDKVDLDDLVPGHKIRVKIEKELPNHRYLGRVDKIIGHKNDPGVDILSIVYDYGINDVFSEDVMNEVDKLPSEVKKEETLERVDLTNECIFTIDGDDTKDIDDAVSIKKDGENYILGVHIADVSYYVKEGTKLYEEAKDRGTSVYLVDRVIPMLPHKLSNGICSLNPGEDRLAISCVMTIDPRGKIISHDIFESVVKSRKQMTYKNVNKVLDGDIPEDYKDFASDLKLMEELATILRKEKLSRGYLDFDTNEAKILVDENCKPYDIVLRERGKGENIIEDFMIAANETVASHIFYMGYPFVYRVHEVPDDEKVSDFLNSLSLMGINIKGTRHFDNPKVMQNILDSLRDKEGFDILSMLLLRCMRKAEYKDQNLGHYGLGSKCYTHFTSPIRRFPDTTVHNLLRKYVFNKPNEHELNELISYYEMKLPEICEHSSKKEKDSIDCERDVEKMKMAEYMESHIGEEYEGTISSCLNFGMFVQLPNMVEGLVHVSDIVGDYFNYNEELNALIGQRTKKMYKIGDKVKIKVINASKETSTIDFELVEKGDKHGNTK